MNTTVDWNINDVIDSHQSRKGRRIRAIAGVLRSKGRVDFKRFLAEMQYNGIRKKVAEEYLDVLKDLGLITYNNNEINMESTNSTRLVNNILINKQTQNRNAWVI